MKAIAAKLSEVGRAIGWGVPKDGHNETQRYDYTSAASVRMAVGPELAKRKLAVQSQLEVISQDFPTAKSGAIHHRVLVRATLTFVCGDTGETISVQGLGGGMDTGDKSIMKAQTAAEKYAYVSAFTLAMGEDPERDESVDRDTRIVPSHSPEDAKRAEEQAATTRQLGAGFVSDFQRLTALDDATAWMAANARAIDALGNAESKRIALDIAAWLDGPGMGIIEGLNGAGFKEGLRAAIMATRTPKHGPKAQEKSNGAG